MYNVEQNLQFKKLPNFFVYRCYLRCTGCSCSLLCKVYKIIKYQSKAINSISQVSVSFCGTIGGYPRLPYASSGGMIVLTICPCTKERMKQNRNRNKKLCQKDKDVSKATTPGAFQKSMFGSCFCCLCSVVCVVQQTRQQCQLTRLILGTVFSQPGTT